VQDELNQKMMMRVTEQSGSW